MGCVLCTDAADPDFHELWNEFRGILVCGVLAKRIKAVKLFNGAEVSEWQAVVYLAAWILLTWQVFAKKKGQSSIGIAEKSVG